MATDNFSIVVLGSMNPMLHHPSFYRRVGMISESEEAAALSAAPLLVTPQFATLQIRGVNVTCLPDRYQVVTAVPDLAMQAMEVVAATMDALPHTPVTAFGFNFDRVRETALPNVGQRFGTLAQGLPLALPSDPTAVASFTYTTSADLPDLTRTVKLTAAPAPGVPSSVLLQYNVNYDVKPVEDLYDLGGMLRRQYPTDMLEAQQVAERTVRALETY